MRLASALFCSQVESDTEVSVFTLLKQSGWKKQARRDIGQLCMVALGVLQWCLLMRLWFQPAFSSATAGVSLQLTTFVGIRFQPVARPNHHGHLVNTFLASHEPWDRPAA